MTALLGRLLSRIGHRLVNWGWRLELTAWQKSAVIQAKEPLRAGDLVTVDGWKAVDK